MTRQRLKLVNVCYYIGDYWYGNASRNIVIVRKILHYFDTAQLYIKADYPFDFIKSSLSQNRNKIMRIKNDIGVIFRNNSASIDRDETIKC